METPRPLLDGGSFFESPRWRDGLWWVSDFYTGGGRVLAVSPEGAIEREIGLEQPSGLGWLSGGDLLAVSMSRHELWRVPAAGGDPEPYADLSAHSRGEANDMCVDAAGRAWVGSFGYDLYAGAAPAAATLTRVDPDGTVHAAAGELHFPNSIIVPPPGDTLIVAETIAARLTAFDLGAGGELSNRRVYAQLAPSPPLAEIAADYSNVGYGPDGCALDAAGCVWAGNSLGNEIVRVAPDGEILATIAAPEPGHSIYATQLGGREGRTLLLCVAPDWRRGMGDAAPRAALYTLEVEVPHHGGLP